MKVHLRKRQIKNNRLMLYLDITGIGKRQRMALNMFLYKPPKTAIEKFHNDETMRQAESIRSTRQLELQGSLHGIDFTPRSKQSFIEFFDRYITEYHKKDVRKLYATKEKLVSYLDGKPFILSQTFVNGFKNYLANNAGLSGETPQMYLKLFKRICMAAFKEKVTRTSPVDIEWTMKFDRQAMRKEVLTPAELKTLAATPCNNEAAKKFFFFCCNTGLRFGDAANLKWGDLKKWKLGIQQGKTGRYVFVELNKTAIALVGKPGAEKERVFATLKGYAGVSKSLKNWYEAAKIDKHITTHCARHTFCTNLMRNKVDTRTIIGLMGWSESSGMRQLMRYAHLVDESLKEAVDSLPEIEF